jgi:hypothetical protein
LKVNAANKERTGSNGSSAMGTYQIVGDTLRRYGPKVLGENWRNAEFNFENQDKIAEAIFNDNKGSADALRSQWVSLSPAEAERLRKMPWSEARNVIARKESSTDIMAKSQAAALGVKQKQASSPDAPLYAQFEKYADDTTDVGGVATRLRGKGGVFEDARQDYVIDSLNNLVRRYKISPALAGVIMSESSDKAINGVLGYGRDNAGNGLRINWKRVDEKIAAYRNYEFGDGAFAANARKERADQIKIAQDNLTRAEANLAERRRRKTVQKDLDLGPDIIAVQEARAALGAVSADTRLNPNLASFKEEKEAKTTPGLKKPKPFSLDEYYKGMEGRNVMGGFGF